MKADEISFGTHEFGNFRVSIQPCVFETRGADEVSVFEVLVIDVQNPTSHFYVNLHEDPRFAWFKHLTTFERKLTGDDLTEYNAYVNAIFTKLAQPTWQLARHSIPRLEKLCLDATKAAKKAARGVNT